MTGGRVACAEVDKSYPIWDAWNEFLMRLIRDDQEITGFPHQISRKPSEDGFSEDTAADGVVAANSTEILR